jgi:hypothetical protein
VKGSARKLALHKHNHIHPVEKNKEGGGINKGVSILYTKSHTRCRKVKDISKGVCTVHTQSHTYCEDSQKGSRISKRVYTIQAQSHTNFQSIRKVIKYLQLYDIEIYSPP